MVAKTAALLTLLLLLAGCGTPASMYRIALLGPFEGRYREVGYDAYYAARLALHDDSGLEVELLALDDGGSPQSARDRAAALALDPRVRVVLLTGYAAAATETQEALGALPAIIIGQWGSQPAGEGRYMLASADLPPESREITEAARLNRNIVGGDVFGLKQFVRLGGDTAHITLITSAVLPSASLRDALLGSSLYVPEPGLLSALSYDATRIAATAARTADPSAALHDTHYDGLNGNISFEAGYWAGAPLHTYRYNAACLQTTEQLCLIEVTPPA